MSEVIVERRDRVAIVTMNRPESLNTFSNELRLGLKRALEGVAADATVRAVVLTGAGRGFSAGADLKGEVLLGGAAIERMLNEEYGPSLRAIANMPKPVIAAINGFATGIGGAFALACDLAVMGEHAFFQVPFAKLGLVPDGGLTYLLTERIGHRRAFEIAMSAERVPAARCLEWGLVNRLVPDDRVVAEAAAWAEQLCDAAPIALGYMKQLLRRAPGLGFEATIREEARLQGACFDSQDLIEGVMAFREKRAPKFTGK